MPTGQESTRGPSQPGSLEGIEQRGPGHDPHTDKMFQKNPSRVAGYDDTFDEPVPPNPSDYAGLAEDPQYELDMEAYRENLQSYRAQL
jgi:hypothetical protein